MSNNTENSGTAFPLALTRAQARFALAAGRALDKLVGEIPPARAATGEAPERQARDIAARAARRAAAISGGLSLPGGLLGIAAILPSLVKVWRIQAQMV
ncbi:MAG: hypothetical protein JNJ60_17155, partial [Rhodocyclaceae bacterium]|nr:hypothetical protein [Rhodocyclaceae bacterium]